MGMLTANCVTVTKTVEWATGDPTGFFFFPAVGSFSTVIFVRYFVHRLVGFVFQTARREIDTR
jgi:hypothetical protein